MNYTMMSHAWSRQIPISNESDLIEMFKVANELGMKTVNMVSTYNIDEIKILNLAKKFSLKIFCYSFGLDLCEWGGTKDDKELISTLKKEISVARKLEAETVMLLICGKEGVSRKENRIIALNRLKKMIAYCLDSGLTPMIENYPSLDGPFLTSEDLLIAVNEIKGLKLIYDIGNCLIAGEKPEEVFYKIKDHINHIHVSDLNHWNNNNGIPQHSLDNKKYSGCVIGSGIINYKNLLKILTEHKYNGNIEIEYHGNEFKPKVGIQKSLNNLEYILK